MTWTVRWMVLAAAVIALAGFDAGPRGIGGPRVSGLFGGQDPEPLTPPCNGKALYDKVCPRTSGSSCGMPYKEIRPELAGALLNKRYDNSDNQMCKSFPYPDCPELFEKKDSGKCTETLSEQP